VGVYGSNTTGSLRDATVSSDEMHVSSINVYRRPRGVQFSLH